MWFEAYPKSHSATVSNYINSLADYKGWSTIKTLPATLPEPSAAQTFLSSNESYSFPIECTDVNPTPLFGPFLIN